MASQCTQITITNDGGGGGDGGGDEPGEGVDIKTLVAGAVISVAVARALGGE